MSVTLNPATEQRINDWIARGRYPDADSLLAEALALLEERDLAELRAKLQRAVDQLERGEGIAYTPELMASVRRTAEERRRRGERASPDAWPE